MPIRWALSATRCGSRRTSSSIRSVCSRAFRVAACCSIVVAVNAACCIEVLNISSPTTPASSTNDTSVTNGRWLVRVRVRGTTVSRARWRAAPARPETRPGAPAARIRPDLIWKAGLLMLLTRLLGSGKG